MSSATSRCSSGIRDIGRIFDAWTIAESRPASTHSCRNTEFSTCRAAGFRPKETFGQPERGLHVRVAALELADRLDRLDGVAPRLLLTGRDREGEAVDEDVAGPHSPAAGEVGDQPLGDPHLPLGRSGLPLLVDRQRDDGGAVLADERHDPGVPRRRARRHPRSSPS